MQMHSYKSPPLFCRYGNGRLLKESWNIAICSYLQSCKLHSLQTWDQNYILYHYNCNTAKCYLPLPWLRLVTLHPGAYHVQRVRSKRIKTRRAFKQALFNNHVHLTSLRKLLALPIAINHGDRQLFFTFPLHVPRGACYTAMTLSLFSIEISGGYATAFGGNFNHRK